MSEESPGKNWKPCFSDPERGVAFFDGLEIHADPITDPRIDRVMPIFQEEQIFVCRHMTHLFDGSPLVLDVGTGSGIYGLWAAKHGCRVIGVDMQARAIRMARKNAQRNDIEEVTRGEVSPGDLPDLIQSTQAGSITLLKRSFDERFVSHLEGISFGIVILSPPYNPTSEELPTKPARHADSGKDGQKCFRNQSKWAREVISDDGIIVGNQMTRQKDSKTGVDGLEASEILNPDSSDEDYRITYVPIIEEAHDIGDFLRRQYANVSSLGDNDLDRYISDVTGGGEYKNWKLVYYESKKMDARSINSQGIEYKPASPSCPAATWEKRISLHRKIVENVAEAGHIPIPSLFMLRPPDSSFESEVGENNRPEYSQISTLNRWVQRELMDQTEGEASPFDVLFVDSAPAFDTIGGWNKDLKGEYKIWLSERLESVVEGGDRLIKEWHKNTIFLQLTGTGPLLHPSFKRQYRQTRWADLHYSYLSRSDSGFVPVDKLRELFPNEDGPLEYYSKKIKESNTIFRNNEGHSGGIEIDDYYSKVSLNKLEVEEADSISFNERVEKNNEEEYSRYLDKMDRDLDLCHELMHYEIRRRIDDQLHEGYKLEWSCLVGIPLTLIPRHRDKNGRNGERVEENGLPSHYRGGVWIWAASLTDDWSKRNDDYLFDLSRLSWLSCNGAYNREASISSSKLASRKKQIQFSHRISPTLGGILSKLEDQAENNSNITIPPEAYILRYKLSISQGNRPTWPMFDSIIESRENVAFQISKRIWGSIAPSVSEIRVREIEDEEVIDRWISAKKPNLKRSGTNRKLEIDSRSDFEDLTCLLVPLLIEAYQHTFLYNILHLYDKDMTSCTKVKIGNNWIEIRNPFHRLVGNNFDEEHNRDYSADELLRGSNQESEIERLCEVIDHTWQVEWPKRHDSHEVGDEWVVLLTHNN